MAGTLRGQLGVKSSPLCPTGSKLTTQYLVLDHMNNHYKKLSKAKCSIDNTPPKSISRSQKVRERNQRNTVSRSGSRMSERPDSQNTFRPYSQLENSEIYDETNWGDPEDDEDTNVMSIMKDVLKKNTNAHVQISERQNTTIYDNTMRWPQKDTYNTQQQQQYSTQLTNRPASSRSMVSMGSRTAPQPGTNKTASSGDVLEKRPHIFTEPDKPFTPRTLKSTRSSRLSEYKYYTAPKKRPEKSNSQENGKDDVDGPSQENAPRPKPRNGQASASGRLDMTNESENTLMYETLQTRDFSRSKQNKSDQVPPLDISVDKDHMNWLQEQASKAQIRAQSSRSQKRAFKGEGTLANSGEFNRSYGLNRSWARNRVTSEGDPDYVEFVKNVTQDVLTRGISTNRVLTQAFENHVQKNKGRLDEVTGKGPVGRSICSIHSCFRAWGVTRQQNWLKNLCVVYMVVKCRPEALTARSAIFQKGQKVIEMLPPTRDAFSLNLKRYNYQAKIWLQEDKSTLEVSSPIDSKGWRATDDGLCVVWTHLPPIPQAFVELVACGCKTKC